MDREKFDKFYQILLIWPNGCINGASVMNPRPLIRLACVGAFLVSSSLPAFADSVATDPVGFLQTTIAPSANGTSRIFTPLSFPLRQSAALIGTVSSVSGNLVNLSSTVGDVTSSPCILHVRSGANTLATGRSFLITASGSSSVTVDSSAYQLQTILASGDSVAIYPANTLSSIFGATDATVKLKAGQTAGSADIVYVWNGTGWSSYYYYTSYGWVLDSDPNYAVQNNSVIFPDEGVLVGRISTNALPITYALNTGTVSVNAQKEALKAPGFSLVSNPLPTPVTLVQFGFTNGPSWISGTTAGNSDIVYVWLNGGWKTFYYYTNYGWVRDDDPNYNIQDSYQIPPGAAVLVQRRGAVTASNAYVPTALNYSLN